MISEVSEASQRILIVKGKAGLGNRFLSLLGSILFCQVHNRLLCVDWSDGAYAPKGVDAFRLAFRCNLPSIPIADVNEDCDVFPPIWRSNLRRSVTDMIDEHDSKYWDRETAVFSRYSIRFCNPCPPNKVVLRWSYHDDIKDFFPMLGLSVFTEAGRFRLLRETIRKHLAFEAGLLEDFESTWTKNHSGETIGVHIRYTDNRNPLRIQLAQLDRLAKEHGQAKIFVATDSAMVESMLTERYKSRVVTTQKSLVENGPPLHRQGLGDEARQSALLDLFLLSKCDYLVYSARSTFGYCAALFSQIPAERRFDCLSKWQQIKRTLNCIKWNLDRRSQ